MNTIPTPDHNVTRDNQQTEAAATPHPCTFPACGSPGEYCRPTCGSSAISAPPPIPAPAAANEAEIHRTPETNQLILRLGKELDEAIERDGISGGILSRNAFIDTLGRHALKLEAERDALRARVAFLERELSKSESLVEFNRSLANSRLDGIEVFQAQLAAATSRADALRRECDAYRKDINGLMEECSKHISLSNDFPWSEEIYCAFRHLEGEIARLTKTKHTDAFVLAVQERGAAPNPGAVAHASSRRKPSSQGTPVPERSSWLTTALTRLQTAWENLCRKLHIVQLICCIILHNVQF